MSALDGFLNDGQHQRGHVEIRRRRVTVSDQLCAGLATVINTVAKRLREGRKLKPHQKQLLIDLSRNLGETYEETVAFLKTAGKITPDDLTGRAIRNGRTPDGPALG